MKRRKKIKSKNRRRAMKFGPSPTSPITLASFLGPLAVLMTKGLAGDREEISMDAKNTKIEPGPVLHHGAHPDCRACLGKGLNTKGEPCRICAWKHKTGDHMKFKPGDRFRTLKNGLEANKWVLEVEKIVDDRVHAKSIEGGYQGAFGFNEIAFTNDPPSLPRFKKGAVVRVRATAEQFGDAFKDAWDLANGRAFVVKSVFCPPFNATVTYGLKHVSRCIEEDWLEDAPLEYPWSPAIGDRNVADQRDFADMTTQRDEWKRRAEGYEKGAQVHFNASEQARADRETDRVSFERTRDMLVKERDAALRACDNYSIRLHDLERQLALSDDRLKQMIKAAEERKTCGQPCALAQPGWLRVQSRDAQDFFVLLAACVVAAGLRVLSFPRRLAGRLLSVQDKKGIAAAVIMGTAMPLVALFMNALVIENRRLREGVKPQAPAVAPVTTKTGRWL